MKKLLIAIPIMMMIPIIGGCEKKTVTEDAQNTSTFSLISNNVTKHPYTRKMVKPELSGMTNRDALQHGFHDTWRIAYQVTGADLSDPIYQEQCSSGGFDLISAENGKIVKSVPFRDFKNNATFDVQGQYNGQGLGLEFSQSQRDFLAQHGWMIMKANSGFIDDMEMQTSYEGDGTTPGGEGDEWEDNYEKIGGTEAPYKRYPYNTMLVTSDLLLHVYHRLFDNSLKYYEESAARPMITDLSKSLFERFTTLTKTTNNKELKKYYEFLAAYRSIPYTLLTPNDEMIDKMTATMNDNPESSDLSDGQIKQMIEERERTIFAELAPTYQASAKATIDEILKADNSQGRNILLETFSPDLTQNFSGFDSLKFDFTQFKPRAHYTTDALLKTYFMAMKRLMREKLFFADKTIAGSSLLMVNNIKDKDLKQFTAFYNFIQRLIGEDDDVNINDIQRFIADQQRTSDDMILKGIDDDTQQKLLTLRPQRIMSVSYTTPGIGDTTEQKAKDMTAGFIFFGEKFTIDSRFFDQFTAGSAEKEGAEKPRVQSALMVADNLINMPITQKFAKLRLEKNQSAFEITPEQIAGYDKVKGEVSKNDILTKFDFGTTTYHTWLDILATLFISGGNNAPYFMEDPWYQNKLLTTYLGSYTELKHDTLLYVKQAYAEMGGAGEGPCVRSIDPPALPVPKGYIEANLDLIDQLITLTQDTNRFFTGDQYREFSAYLQLVRKIALAQTQNQKIDDADFDKLRLSRSELYSITTPTKLFGYALQKEKRGSIIADIFTSGKYGPLYEAVGRPYLMAMMINDVNGSRIAIGPVFSQYEFYEQQASFKPVGGGRYTDQDRQNTYDALSGTTEKTIMSLPFHELMQAITH